MINVRRAINRYTSARVLYQDISGGAYDEDNLWVEGTIGLPVPIMATPRPYGDRDSGTYGEKLSPTSMGERSPSYMLFHVKRELAINSFITVYGSTYKIVRRGNYSAGGYSDWVGEKLTPDKLYITYPQYKLTSSGVALRREHA